MYPIYRLAVKDGGYVLRRAVPAYGGEEWNAWPPRACTGALAVGRVGGMGGTMTGTQGRLITEPPLGWWEETADDRGWGWPGLTAWGSTSLSTVTTDEWPITGQSA